MNRASNENQTHLCRVANNYTTRGEKAIEKGRKLYFVYMYIYWMEAFVVYLSCVEFYGISTIQGYLMPNPLYTYILNIYRIWFGRVLWHINHCRLFNAKSFLYIYIRYIWFGLVGFYGISTIVCYLMPNPLYTYILNIYDLVWLGFMAYQLL